MRGTRIALPTGGPRESVAELLRAAGLGIEEYEPGSRVMRSQPGSGALAMRIFRERDIPIQLATGNYDLGVCSDAYVTEHRIRFPRQHVVRVGSLPGAQRELWLAAAPQSGLNEGTLPSIAGMNGAVIASEFPNLADLVAVRMRLPGYRLLHVAGAVEAYPPIDADLVLIESGDIEGVRAKGLVPLARVFRGGLALYANSDALSRRDLSLVLGGLRSAIGTEQPDLSLPVPGAQPMRRFERDRNVVRIAIPDGHAQRHAPGVLQSAGLVFDGYDEKSSERNPTSAIAEIEAKVVRPQDMPQLVALGAFDIGLSGRDLLHEHHCRFPGSPVGMAVDLGTNRYRIGPVVDQAFPADTTPEAVALWNAMARPVRIASEFPATAERFAREQRLRFTTIIPVAGASEGFVPEDADVLVEGTETGTSIRANGLKMLDPFMESTSCILVRTVPATTRTRLFDEVVDRFRAAAQS
ncbi:MAG: ATP phosphoribosyltransferase [Dehalococcoidia bacterium]|nr:ATP phosphoribosyltransferase [Dehalococcoidia bacterium]